MYQGKLYSVFVVVVVGVLFVSRSCQGAFVSNSDDRSTFGTFSGRLFFWEKCEDQWNEAKKRTEKCCTGNYKCSSDICKENKLCKFGLLGGNLWCHNSSCEPKDKKDGEDKDNGDKDKKDKDKKDKDKKDKDKEKDKKDKDKKKKDEKDKDKKDKDKKDKDKKDKDKKDKDKKDKDKDKGGDKDKDEKASPSPSPPAKASPSSSPSPPSPSPSLPPPPPTNDDPLHCNGRRERREFRDLTPAQRSLWQQAILSLRGDRDANGESEWDRLVRVHMQSNDEAHGGVYFLPWHRLFLLRLENALREKQPDLALPYWDWTRDAADAALSPVWEPSVVGGARRNAPIQNGAFQNMDARVPEGHIVQRGFTSGVSGEMDMLWGMGSLNQLIDGEDFEGFSDGVEAAHALPHIFIGGDMGDAFRAPNDPVFYMHHAFVDYLWAIRQQRRGVNDFGGTHDFGSGTQQGSADRVMGAFGKTVRESFDLGCVHYVAPSGGNLGGRGGRGGRNTGGMCNDEHFESGNILSKERCEKGESHLVG